MILACAAMMCACAPPHILKTGALEHPAYLAASDLAIGLEFVQSGTCWTNVWMDILASPQSAAETTLDPSAFSLRASDTGLTIKHVARQIVASGFSGCGSREPQEWGLGGKGTRAPTTVIVLKPGEIVRATLMFETGPDQAQFLKEFDLLYKGRAMHFGSRGVRDMSPKLRQPDEDY